MQYTFDIVPARSIDAQMPETAVGYIVKRDGEPYIAQPFRRGHGRSATMTQAQAAAEAAAHITELQAASE